MIQSQMANMPCLVKATALAIFAVSVAAADEPRVLEVPASSAALQVAVAIEPGSVVGQRGIAQATSLGLIELDAQGATIGSAIAAQLVPAATAEGKKSDGGRQLLAIIAPGASAKGTRRFRLQSVTDQRPGVFHFEKTSDRTLRLSQGDHPVFAYNHGEITDRRVPENDSRRRRGCYIHPVWGPGGEVITDDFPKDHYHHHGIFWAWPHVRIGEKQYDLWMYRNIRQRFVRWICRESGPLAAVLAVENGWFVGDRKVMIERVWIRTFAASGQRRILDITLTFIPVDRAITLRGAAGKSYGGLTMRFAPRDSKQTVITVPAGRTTADLTEARLPWADYTSLFAGANTPSGATLMIDPAHPDFPPTWLTRHYGPLCVGYPGVRAKTFQPGKALVLNYRVSVHGGSSELADLKRDYAGYTAALKARWSK